MLSGEQVIGIHRPVYVRRSRVRARDEGTGKGCDESASIGPYVCAGAAFEFLGEGGGLIIGPF